MPSRAARPLGRDHLRSQQLGEGTVLQGRYDPKTKKRTEGYGPTQVPYELVA